MLCQWNSMRMRHFLEMRQHCTLKIRLLSHAKNPEGSNQLLQGFWSLEGKAVILAGLTFWVSVFVVWCIHWKLDYLNGNGFKEISYVYLHNTPIAVQMLHPQPVVSLSLASNMIRTGYPHRTATLVRHQLPKRWHLSKGFRHGLQGTTLATSWHLQFKGRPTLTQPNKHHGRGCCVPPCRSSTMA